MSIAAEIVMQRLAQRLAGDDGMIALSSELGLASPGVEAAANVVRLALNPVGGMRRRPAAMFSPPIDMPGSQDEAVRVLRSLPVLADFNTATVSDRVERLRRLSGRTPDVLRLRGSVAGISGMELLFSDAEMNEAVFVTENVRSDGVCDGLNPAEPGFLDEFDALAISAKRGIFESLNFTAEGADLHLDPLSCLDLPDACQIDAALGEGHVRPDEGGACSLAVPCLGASSAGFRLGLSLPGFDGRLKAVASGAADIFAASSGPADCWAIEGTFIGGAEAALVDFLAPGCGAGSTVTNVALKIARRRGAWEAWDEADAQLALEESW